MAIYWRDLWQQVAVDYGGEVLNGVATGGSVVTLADTSALAAYADDWWEKGWVYMLSGAAIGQIRLITTLAANTLTFPALTAPVVAGDTYFLWTGRPKNDLVRAAMSALQAAFPAFYKVTQDSTLVVIADTRDYTLPVTVQHIIRVEQGFDETPDHYVEVEDWRQDGRTLRLKRGNYLEIGALIRITWAAPIAVPATDATLVDIDIAWENDLLKFVGAYGAMLLNLRSFPREAALMREHTTLISMIRSELLGSVRRMPQFPGRTIWAEDPLGWTVTHNWHS